MSDQIKVFSKPINRKKRKCIISTNIAETSVTLDGIAYVIDSGFERQKFYNPLSGAESLIVTQISQSSANQRAGRAGRIGPGKCFRLYPSETVLAGESVSELHRSNLASVILQLKALGIDDLLSFPFLTVPPIEIIAKSLENLYALGAIDDTCKLTTSGQLMAELSIDPRLSKMILASVEYECTEEVLTIVSLLSVQSIYWNTSSKSKLRIGDSARRKFWVKEGDLITLLNIYNGFEDSGKTQEWCSEHHLNHKALLKAQEIRTNLVKSLSFFNLKIESCGQDVESLQKCILS